MKHVQISSGVCVCVCRHCTVTDGVPHSLFLFLDIWSENKSSPNVELQWKSNGDWTNKTAKVLLATAVDLHTVVCP